MISYLSGQVKLTKNKLIILAKGVGYGVKINPQVLNSLKNNQNINLFIYTHVKEDKLELYGFKKYQEQELFELVLGVSGVGPSTALSLVSMGSKKLITSVQNAQVSSFTAIPRVGKKLAQKIIIDLKGKLGELKALDLKPKSSKYLDIENALLNLGFSEQKISQALEKLDLEKLEEQEIIKKVIKLLK